MVKYKLKFESEKHFLSARVVGLPPHHSAAYESFADLAMRSYEVGQKRLLIECSGADGSATNGNSAFLTAINDFLRMSHGIKAAIVIWPDTLLDRSSLSIRKLAETGAHVGYFNDRSAAEAWLVAGSVPNWPPAHRNHPTIIAKTRPGV